MGNQSRLSTVTRLVTQYVDAIRGGASCGNTGASNIRGVGTTCVRCG